MANIALKDWSRDKYSTWRNTYIYEICIYIYIVEIALGFNLEGSTGYNFLGGNSPDPTINLICPLYSLSFYCSYVIMQHKIYYLFIRFYSTRLGGLEDTRSYSLLKNVKQKTCMRHMQ